MEEFVGFIIVLFIFLFPLLRKILLKKARPEPEETTPLYDEETKIPDRKQSSQIKKPYTTRRLLKNDFAFEANLDERQFESRIDERQLETRIDPKIDDQIVSSVLEPPAKKTPNKHGAHAFLLAVQKRPLMQQVVVFSEILEKRDEY